MWIHLEMTDSAVSIKLNVIVKPIVNKGIAQSSSQLPYSHCVFAGCNIACTV